MEIITAPAFYFVASCVFNMLYQLVLVAMFFQSANIPRDVAVVMACYSLYDACVMILGLVGISKRRSTLLYIFSNHLFADIIISAAPKFVVLLLSQLYIGDICSVRDRAIYDPATSYTIFNVPTTDITSFMSLPKLFTGEKKGWCGITLQAAQIGFALCAIALSIAQWKVAMAVRNSAHACAADEDAGLSGEQCKIQLNGSYMSLDDEKMIIVPYTDNEETIH